MEMTKQLKTNVETRREVSRKVEMVWKAKQHGNALHRTPAMGPSYENRGSHGSEFSKLTRLLKRVIPIMRLRGAADHAVLTVVQAAAAKAFFRRAIYP
jgi:hypothetical protein